MQKVYMLVYDDEYELPAGVFDNVKSLAGVLGISTASCYCAISRGVKHTFNGKKSKIVKMELEEE